MGRLWYLETLLGGSDVMDPYLKAHVVKFSQKTVDTEVFVFLHSFLFLVLFDNDLLLV